MGSGKWALKAAQIFLVAYLGATDEVGQGNLEVLCGILLYAVMRIHQDMDAGV